MIVVKNLNGQQTDKLKKRIIQVFKNFGFKTEIKTNLFEVLFLDVTFRLIKGTFQPYKKTNNNLSYIYVFSNNPPDVIKRLLNSVNNLLLRNSSRKEIFDNTKENYQKGLDTSLTGPECKKTTIHHAHLSLRAKPRKTNDVKS